MLNKSEMKRFAKLLRPYSSGRKRSLARQVEWLSVQHNHSDDCITLAMRMMYGRMYKGKRFKDGHELDRHLLDMCRVVGYMKNEQKLNIERKSISLGWKTRLWNWLNKPRGYFKQL